jgi:hypothetical protein
MYSDQKMLFITGASRSGTTLMSFILRNQADIVGLNELQYFGEFWDPRSESQLDAERAKLAVATLFARQRQSVFIGRPLPEDMDRAEALLRSLDEKSRTPAELFAAAVHQLAVDAGKTVPCEQTPRNIFYAEALLKLYPNAYVIHMMRDPRAVMASQKQRWKRRRNATDKRSVPRSHTMRTWINYHPYTMARLWRGASAIVRRLRTHPRFSVVRFEDLLGNPEATLRDLCERVRMDYDPAMQNVGQINSSHQSSVGGARKGFHRDAIDKWKTELSPTEISITERYCGSLMEDFGYPVQAAGKKRWYGEFQYRLSYPLHIVGVLMVNPRRALIQVRALLSKFGSGGPQSVA